MPRRQCEKGHHWESAAGDYPQSCPLCGSAVVVQNVMVNQNASARDDTLEKPVAVSSADKTSITQVSSGGVAQPSDNDDTLNFPQRQNGLARPQGNSATEIEPAENDDETLEKSSSDVQATPRMGRHPAAPDNDNATVDFAQQAPVTQPAQSVRETPKQVLGGYEILGVLGRGGMGVVYKARQMKLNRMTALKMILSGTHASQSDLSRFQTEAEAVAQLQHPNIVQIHEVGEADGRPFFSLEYIDGGNLREELNDKAYAPRKSAETMKTLAAAVHYAHDRHIIHRDLKPANVLLTKDGVPKITDFGLAKSLKEDSGQTGSGTILGTPSFMSPEQAVGKTQELGPATDIYSLGAILYDMLTGRPPFVGESVMDTLNQVKNNDPVPPRRLQPRVPRDLEVICLKCLHKEPQRRYPSAKEMAEDLGRFLDGAPIQARPVGVGERTWKWVRRRPGVAALLSVLFLVIFGGLALTTTLWLRASKAESNAMKSLADLGIENAKVKKAREDADGKAAEALTEKEKALKAMTAADKANKEVLDQYKIKRRILYVTRMSLVQQALGEGYRDVAEQLLGKSEKDLRGFEWKYANNIISSTSRRIKGHANRITQVIFSDDGSLLATAGLDRTVIVWDVASGQEKYTLDRHDNPIRSIVFSADGSRLATATSGGNIQLWNIKTGKKIAAWTAHEQPIRALAFNPTGDKLASVSDDKTVKIWNTNSAAKREIMTLAGHRYAVRCVAFHPTRNVLATGSEDKTVILWNLATKKAEHQLKGHQDWVTCLDFSNDGEKLATGSMDRTIRLWDVQRRTTIRVLAGHQEAIHSVAISPEGSKLASSETTGTIKVWDLLNEIDPKTLPGSPDLVRTVAFSNDGQLLASINFLLRQTDATPVFIGHHGTVTSIVVTKGGHVISAGAAAPSKNDSSIGEMLIWDSKNTKKIEKSFRFAGLIRSVALSPNGKTLCAVGEDELIHLFDFPSKKKLASWRGHSSRILSTVFHPTMNNVLATSGEDGRVHIWDLYKQAKTFTIDCKSAIARQIAFSPNGKILALGLDDGAIELWDVALRSKLRSLGGTDGHQARVSTLAFHPKNKLLASGSSDQTIRIWNYETGELKFAPMARHMDEITQVIFSPDGSRLVSAALDHNIKIWDANTGEETWTLKGHRAGVTCLAFTTDGHKLLSGSLDRTVRIWDGS